MADAAELTSDFVIALQTLNYATRLVAAELDGARLVDRALDTLVDFGRARRAALFEVQEETTRVEVSGSLNASGLVDPDLYLETAGGPLERVIDDRRPALFGLAPGESLPLPVVAGGAPGRECLVIPLVGSHNRVLALATLDRSDDEPLTELEQQVLDVVGTLVGVALENARLFKLATVDGLTDLYVRRYFEIRLTEELARLRRAGGALALIMTDIDHFKQFNDTYGHQMGDRVLRELATVMRETVRKAVDIPCRYGGEEFVCILPATNLDGARLLAERLRQAVERHSVNGPSGPVPVTISAGVAALETGAGIDETEFVRRADSALYRAKETGRNRVCWWEDE